METPGELRASTLDAQGLPLVLQPAEPAYGLLECVSAHRAWIRQALTAHGAILFRDFALTDPVGQFSQFSAAITGQLLDYVYRSTPRTQLAEKVYSATEYPPKATIPQHNENAYNRDWPMKLMFICTQPAPVGGSTPISSTVRVTARIAPEIFEKFKRLGVLYVRNYRDTIDLPWQNVFQTDKREDVERFCAEHGIRFEWKADGTLRTSQVCQGTAVHPETGAELWFNQAHLFHASSLDKASYNALQLLYKEDEFPRQTFYGDGTSIEPDVLDHIRAAFAAETRVFRWKKNDILLVDNMQVGHGREPFSGPRKVLVSMGEPYSACAVKAQAA